MQINCSEIHAFFDKHEVTPADREDYLLSLLAKAAKSTCIIKSHVVIDAIMDARNKMAQVMYYGSTDLSSSGVVSPEMSAQELDFLEMAEELKDPAQGGKSTMQLLLKYSPDSVTRLFDRCLEAPCLEQVVKQQMPLFYSRDILHRMS